ncbi:MAG: caspase family protein [Alphaproteobacteria bacterium]|nr:caspase family protein [Alphaproteobacteria bacterium]
MSPLLLVSSVVFAAGTRGVEADVPEPADYGEAAAARRVALVVGIDDYADPELGALKFAAKDARDVAAALEDPQVGDFTLVRLLEGSVTRQDLDSAFDALTAGLQRDDTFVFYFAGHGTLDIEDDHSALYLLPADAHLIHTDDQAAERKALWLAVEELQQRVEALPVRNRVVIIDACHNGTGRSQLSETTRRHQSTLRGVAPAPEVITPQRTDAWLFAAYFNQPAREDDTLQNGVFTHYLVKALRAEGDMDGDGLVDVSELHTYVADRTGAFTGNTQTPWMRSTEVGANPIYLAGDPNTRKRAEKAIVYGHGRLPSGTESWMDGQVRGVGGVEPGWHEVELRQGGAVLVRTPIRLRAGQRLDLAELADRRARSWLLGVGGDLTVPIGPLPTVQPWAATLQASWYQADAGGMRLGRVVTASGAYGAVGEREALLTAEALAGVRLMWGQSLLVGPGVDVGVLWRSYLDPLYWQMRGVVAPTLGGTWLGDRGFVTVEFGTQIVPLWAEKDLWAIATGRLVAGLRL